MAILIKKLIGDERAQDFAEYAVALAVIGLGAGLAAIALATNLSTVWSTAQSIIASVASGA